MSKKLSIWVDVVNSPHVLFFVPVIRRLEELGHKVTVTAREYAQTVPLLEKQGIKADIFGKHAGKSVLKKAAAFLRRSSWLVMYGLNRKFDLALSHNSNDLALAAAVLDIPHIMFHDYEYAITAHRLNSLFVDRLVFPEPVRVEKLEKMYRKKIFANYPGLKEQVYLPHWKFVKARKELGIDGRKVLGVVRPPADFSLYHRFDNPLFYDVLEYLSASRACVVVLPRTQQQEQELKKRYPGFIFPDKPVDGPSLIREADFVVSAGGTMNREAAVLGTPAYSIFAGRLGDVDKYLIERGFIKLVSHAQDIRVVRKRKQEKPAFPSNLDSVVEKILSIYQEIKR